MGLVGLLHFLGLSFVMSLEKFFWKFVFLVVIITLVLGGIFLSRDVILGFFAANLARQSIAEVRSLEGDLISPERVNEAERLLMISSEVKDLQMTWNGLPVGARLVIDPQLRGVESSVTQGDRKYQWLLSVPQEQAQDISQFCLRRPEASAPSQCYRFQHANSVETVVSSCGNGLLESGEQCDDGNVIDDDQCDNKCLQPLLRAGEMTFPRPDVTGRLLDDGRVQLFVLVQQYPAGATNPVDLEKLSLRLTINSDLVLNSPATDRINGFPFLSTTVDREDTLLLELVYRDGDLELIPLVQVVDLQNPDDPLVQDLKSAAMEIPRDPFQVASLDLASIDWLGSEKTVLDLQGQRAIDVSSEGRGFLTRVAVRSLADEEMSVSAKLLDQQVSFTHQIPPQATDELVLNVADLPYGEHQLLMTAHFASGEKIADVVIPFEYTPATFVGRISTRFQLWQLIGIGVLLALGSVYVAVRGMRIVGALMK